MDLTNRIAGTALTSCVLQELIDPESRFMLNDTVKIVAELSITDTYGMCVNIFTAECNPDSDVVVRVQNERFHVDKRVSWNKANSLVHRRPL